MATKSAPPRPAPPASNPTKRSLPPNQTLYVTNLPDKLRKDDLRLSLYTLFSTYGPVLDVVALKTMKMRGQAFIAYRDLQSSTQAMRALQGFNFFEKELKIEYAKSKSNTIAKLDGTYRAPGAQVEITELQQTIFNAPPSSITNLPATSSSAPTTLKPPDADDGISEEAKSPQGTKRRRDEKDDASDDAPMDEDDDGDAPMEDSSDED